MPIRQFLRINLIVIALQFVPGLWTIGQAESGPLCFVEDQGVCLWPAASGDAKPRQQRHKVHAGEPGRIGHDGEPVPDHVCDTCHEETDLLPEAHLPTAGMSMLGCRICHGAEEVEPLDDHIFQSHTHFFAEVTCADCHEDPEDPYEPEIETCTKCHGPISALAAATADIGHANPHDSPHGAPYQECVLCHYQHEPPDNFCANCHEFDFTMP